MPNLIYSDGTDWALFREGSRVDFVSFPDIRKGQEMPNKEQIKRFHNLVQKFLSWEPTPPTTAKKLAQTLAPLCQLLRNDILKAMENEDSSISKVSKDWKAYLFPEATDFQFADSYAQTLTYGLLLAKLDRTTDLDIFNIDQAKINLSEGYALLSQTLSLLSTLSARAEIETGIELLERTINTIDPDQLIQQQKKGEWLWVYFYEQFLEEYDPSLRKNTGVYYTPAEVIKCQVNLIDELLTKKFQLRKSFASENVITIDPALGTGTYLLGIIDFISEKTESELGQGMIPTRATELAKNIYGFEILVGPYTVANLRLTQRFQELGVNLKGNINKNKTGKKLNIFLTDTLESPYATAPQRIPNLLDKLGIERAEAQNVKMDKKVFICLGNPPYGRHSAENQKGGWIRFGTQKDAPESTPDPILEDFIKPVIDQGLGGDLKNIYNLYIYFWRWALWKVFENQGGPGIISFISASSFLSGKAFLGMRKMMREIFDEILVIDLSGDALGVRKEENIFDIRTPVAITIGYRKNEGNPDQPSKVYYSKLAFDSDSHKKRPKTPIVS